MAIDQAHRRAGERTAGLSLNLGSRCTVWITEGADDDDKEDQRPCLYLEVLPTQSTMTMMTLIYDATTNLMVRCIPGIGEGGVISTMIMDEEDNDHNNEDNLVFLQCGGTMMSYLLRKANFVRIYSWQRGEG